MPRPPRQDKRPAQQQEARDRACEERAPSAAQKQRRVYPHVSMYEIAAALAALGQPTTGSKDDLEARLQATVLERGADMPINSPPEETVTETAGRYALGAGAFITRENRTWVVPSLSLMTGMPIKRVISVTPSSEASTPSIEPIEPSNRSETSSPSWNPSFASRASCWALLPSTIELLFTSCHAASASAADLGGKWKYGQSETAVRRRCQSASKSRPAKPISSPHLDCRPEGGCSPRLNGKR